ncbi:MAG TPA: NAD(+)/NADH kinase [Deltaproteobacteria bacterium]|nr:NAD(+)/NADH kinase [Deltaproteobacteria bacterium]
MKKIGFVVNHSKPRAVRFVPVLCRWLTGRGVTVYVDDALDVNVRGARVCRLASMPRLVDAIVVLGGDGTMLSAARIVGGRKVPLVGVNLGGLGFLTSVTEKEVFGLLERMLEGDYGIEERMMLAVKVRRGRRVVARHDVLNDAVLKGVGARLVRLETRINREYVTTYRADGLIVATPTGSTAYSLSAAGPILYPTIHSIIVVPICPFNLTNRPLVIPDWMQVEVRLCADPAEIRLTLDGQVETALACGDVIDMRRSSRSIYLVRHRSGKSYFDILRERLLWEVKADSHPLKNDGKGG